MSFYAQIPLTKDRRHKSQVFKEIFWRIIGLLLHCTDQMGTPRKPRIIIALDWISHKWFCKLHEDRDFVLFTKVFPVPCIFAEFNEYMNTWLIESNRFESLSFGKNKKRKQTCMNLALLIIIWCFETGDGRGNTYRLKNQVVFLKSSNVVLWTLGCPKPPSGMKDSFLNFLGLLQEDGLHSALSETVLPFRATYIQRQSKRDYRDAATSSQLTQL